MQRLEADLRFTRPIRQVVLLVTVTAVVALGLYATFPMLRGVFLAKPLLNGFVGLVFLFGIIICFLQLLQLLQSVRWIDDFVRRRPGHNLTTPPRLLAPLAALLRSRGAKMQISSSNARSILDSVGTRIDEQRDITRYIANLLIFLGLLGTFYGLATTVPAMVETIRSLAPQENETRVQVFDKLMSGLEGQLDGMGTAFSSSLLGLAGSLVVGLLELFVSHGTNRFYRELEEWLSTITRLGFSAEGEAPASRDGAMIADALNGMAEQMEALQSLYTQSDIARALVDDRLVTLAASVDRLVDRLGREDGQKALLSRIADGQDRLAKALAVPETGAHVDAESRMRLRSIDVQLLRILEEISAGRQESIADLRGDLAALTAAVRQLSRGAAGRG
ncbi:MAG: biopolymer transporter ExbB [Rhodobacter sp.]|nr:biopolymer transporter ExbB [Rhodobacter sp.]MCA3493204.1 biopolymer transporter ExbB [Rhodobacter sp.]MCA3499739.1 biopolymer transporter ExbB [Rhodobacter sp.]MCA3504347.1 biopolymer transporter ExbB [Rhodobacter sp.]MCA3516503.1 biopolymer transporter ExbB [Rhodobacter sp.]